MSRPLYCTDEVMRGKVWSGCGRPAAWLFRGVRSEGSRAWLTPWRARCNVHHALVERGFDGGFETWIRRQYPDLVGPTTEMERRLES